MVAGSKEKVKRDRILDEGKEEEIEKKEGGKARGRKINDSVDPSEN